MVGERSIGELLSDLFRQGSELLQEELTLARLEMSNKTSRVGSGAAFIGAGALVAYAGFLAVVAALIMIVHAILPWWASALLVGLVLIAGGYLGIRAGLDTIKRQDLTPHRTIETLRGFSRMKPNGNGSSGHHSTVVVPETRGGRHATQR
jgi:hypothetical protein